MTLVNMSSSKRRNKFKQSAPAETVNKTALININAKLSEETTQQLNEMNLKFKLINEKLIELVDECNNLRERCSAYEYMLFDGTFEFEHDLVPPPIEFSDDYKSVENNRDQEPIPMVDLEDDSKEQNTQIDNTENPFECISNTDSNSYLNGKNEDHAKAVKYGRIYASDARINFGAESGLNQEFIDYYFLNIIKDLDLMNTSKMENYTCCIRKLILFYQNDAHDFFSKVETIYNKHREKAGNYPDITHYFKGLDTEQEIGNHAYTHRIRTNYTIVKFHDLRDELLETCEEEFKEMLSEEPVPFGAFINQTYPPNPKMMNEILSRVREKGERERVNNNNNNNDGNTNRTEMN